MLGSSQGCLLYNAVPTSALLFPLRLSKLCVGASKTLVFKQIFFSFAQNAVQCVYILPLQTGGKVAKWFLRTESVQFPVVLYTLAVIRTSFNLQGHLFLL